MYIMKDLLGVNRPGLDYAPCAHKERMTSEPPTPLSNNGDNSNNNNNDDAGDKD